MVHHLLDLPPELLTAICVLVACPTVVACRRVCRRLRDVVDGSLELQYCIELDKDGLIDAASDTPGIRAASASAPPPSTNPSPIAMAMTPCTSAERLVRLHALRRAWATLAWTARVTIPMPGPCCAYELVGGVFCKTQPTPPASSRARHGGNGSGGRVGTGTGTGMGMGWPAMQGNGAEGEGNEDGDGDGGLRGSRTMSATWLPGRSRLSGLAHHAEEGEGNGSRREMAGDGWHTAVRDDLGIPTRDFAVDPSQDVVVLIKGGNEEPVAGIPMIVYEGVLELHVRTMSTHQAHPEARLPVLCTVALYPVTSVFLQIVDDVVGVMHCVDPVRPRLTIWNWKTGQLVVDRTSSRLPPATWDFSFIHSRALFVTTSDRGGTLALFTFTCDPVVDADRASGTDTGTDTLTHVATLHLPPVQPSVRVLTVGTHTGPFLAGCPADAALLASNAARIYVLTVQYSYLPPFGGLRTRPRMCVYVHHRTLARYVCRCDAAQGVGLGMGVPIEVPWAAWGPTQARMMPHIGLFQWLRYVHGQRVVMLLPASKAGQSTFQVLDFNVRRCASESDADALKAEEGEEDVTCVYRPTRIAIPNIFVDTVETRLPYRDVRRDVQGEYSGVMIDDERLIGLKYPAFLTGNMKEIDVYTM